MKILIVCLVWLLCQFAFANGENEVSPACVATLNGEGRSLTVEIGEQALGKLETSELSFLRDDVFKTINEAERQLAKIDISPGRHSYILNIVTSRAEKDRNRFVIYLKARLRKATDPIPFWQAIIRPMEHEYDCATGPMKKEQFRNENRHYSDAAFPDKIDTNFVVPWLLNVLEHQTDFANKGTFDIPTYALPPKTADRDKTSDKVIRDALTDIRNTLGQCASLFVAQMVWSAMSTVPKVRWPTDGIFAQCPQWESRYRSGGIFDNFEGIKMAFRATWSDIKNYSDPGKLVSNFQDNALDKMLYFRRLEEKLRLENVLKLLETKIENEFALHSEQH